MCVRFGTAGIPSSFSAMGYKKTLQVGEYLEKFSLNHFEYQCGQGVTIGEKSAVLFGEALAKKNISVSLHAPYYISLSGIEEEKRLNSVNYILKSAAAVKNMGGDRIIIHSGSCAKMPREAALSMAVDTMRLARRTLIENELENIRCCPETMGKINQLGDLHEVIEICKSDESFIPCIDFGHLNARTFGGIKGISDYKKILDMIENELGSERLKTFHAHFSKIEYTQNGGEKKHLTFSDEIYGPNFEPLLELVYKKSLSPVFICESDGTQAEDAKTMMDYYHGLNDDVYRSDTLC